MQDFLSSFDSMIAAGWSFKFIKALLALFAAVWFSRWLDRRAQRDGAFSPMFKLIIESGQFGNYMGLRWLGIALLFGMLVGCAPANAAPIGKKYDARIAAAVEMWWPDYPFPAAWKAQLYQESRLDPLAVSPVGAAGLAQFMPGTWAQITREMRLGNVSPASEVAIDAGAYYMRKLRRSWSAPRPAEDRQRLAQASYNAGLGNILEAQERCGGPPGWREISACLPAVTGRHAQETLTYVERIAKWRMLLEAGG